MAITALARTKLCSLGLCPKARPPTWRPPQRPSWHSSGFRAHPPLLGPGEDTVLKMLMAWATKEAGSPTLLGSRIVLPALARLPKARRYCSATLRLAAC